MAPSKHWHDTIEKVRQRRALDALLAARLRMPAADWRKLKHSVREDPQQFRAWHAAIEEGESQNPQIALTYTRMRDALRTWPEFAGLGRKAFRILELVIELARDEALPWYVAVGAEEVRRLARTHTSSWVIAAPDLQAFTVTRPARVVNSEGPDGSDLSTDESSAISPITQFVVRYHKGLSWNRNRSAWWINYDLLCGTGRVQRCFVARPDEARSDGEDALIKMEAALSRHCPPPIGFRSPLWRDLPLAASR